MSRFFKSAAFPILIVVVLAFFAQKLISNSPTERNTSFADFLTQLDHNQVAKATVKAKDNTVAVQLRDKQKYEFGFVDAYGKELTDKLTQAKAQNRIDDFNVEGRKS